MIYHASHNPLEIGTVLDRSQFMQYQFQWDMVCSALLGEPEPRNLAVLKALLLTDVFIGSGTKQVLPFVLKEVIAEHVRSREFADKPERLKSTFLSPSIEDARRFREMTRQFHDRPYLYECSIPDGTLLFSADAVILNSANSLAQIDEQVEYLTSQARAYWSGDECDNPCAEVLVPLGSVTITAEGSW